jgi:hypothetical protein
MRNNHHWTEEEKKELVELDEQLIARGGMSRQEVYVAIASIFFVKYGLRVTPAAVQIQRSYLRQAANAEDSMPTIPPTSRSRQATPAAEPESELEAAIEVESGKAPVSRLGVIERTLDKLLDAIHLMEVEHRAATTPEWRLIGVKDITERLTQLERTVKENTELLRGLQKAWESSLGLDSQIVERRK